MHVFGLTGGIASGKSGVAAHFRAQGLSVIDADVVAREVVAPGTDGLRDIVSTFGPSVLLPTGELSRKRLGEIVFGDAEALRTLNRITHPRIAVRTQALISELAERGEPLACYEAALLVENGLADAFRPLVVVSVPEAEQRRRIVERDGLTEAEAQSRIEAQMPLADKVAAADHVIETRGSVDETRARSHEVLRRICTQFGVDPARYRLAM